MGDSLADVDNTPAEHGLAGMGDLGYGSISQHRAVRVEHAGIGVFIYDGESKHSFVEGPYPGQIRGGSESDNVACCKHADPAAWRMQAHECCAQARDRSHRTTERASLPQLRMFAEAWFMHGTDTQERRCGTEHARSIVVRVDDLTCTLTGTPQPAVATELDKSWEPNSVYAPGPSDKVK